MMVSRLMRYIEARTLIISGLLVTCSSLYAMTGWTEQTSFNEIAVISTIQGFGFGLVFVPLSTVTFLTLSPKFRGDGTSMLTLLRNVASSIGISIIIAQLTSGTKQAYARLSEHVTPFNNALQMPDVNRLLDLGTNGGRAMMDGMLNMQAAIIAFARDYELVIIFILASIPLVFLLGSSKDALRRQGAAAEQTIIE